VALSHSSRIQRVACATGQVDEFSMLTIRRASADRWCGIRTQRMQAPGPGELPDSYLLGHVVTINDRPAPWTAKWIDGPEVRLGGDGRPDAVCVFPALQPYRCSWDKKCAGILIELSPELVDEAAGRGAAAHVQLRPGFLDDDDVIPTLAEALLNLATHDDPSSSLLAESLGLGLAAYLVQRCATIEVRVQRHRGGVEPHTVRLLDQFIDARLDTPVSLHELARLVGMSVSHFAHWRSKARRFRKIRLAPLSTSAVPPTTSATARATPNKAVSDNNCQVQLAAICDEYFWPLLENANEAEADQIQMTWGDCKAFSWVYYEAVSTRGASAYDSAQAKVCRCCIGGYDVPFPP